MDTAALIVPLVYPLETLKARKVLMQVTDVRAVIAIGRWLPYDGEADRWFDPNWLVADGRT
jgi:hypothetical protein